MGQKGLDPPTYLFELFFAQFVLSLLGFQETVELFLLLTLNVVLELLFIIAECFCLLEKHTA